MTSLVDVIAPSPVERVRTANGSMIDPPCPPYGDERERLAWLLGVVHADTGIRLELHDYGDHMNLSGPGFCTGPLVNVWREVSMFQTGAEMARKVDAT